MNKIVKSEVNDIVRISSREVAAMMESTHSNLLRKIKGLNEDFTQIKIDFSKYWIENTYKDASGKENNEYLISKDGCELLAHKSTGKKGTLFTVKYMERFKEMEKQLKDLKPQISEKEQMLLKLFSNDPIEVAQAHKKLVSLEVEEATQPLIETIEEQTPEVEFSTRVQENNQKVYSMSETAKLLKLPYGNRTLFAKLRDMKVLRNNNEPYQNYTDRGYFILKITDTGYKLVSTTKVTGKGLRWLENKREELIS